MTKRDRGESDRRGKLIHWFGAVAALSLTATSAVMAAEATHPDPGPDIKTMCGTKPAVVALADGFGGNTWRKTTLAEFKDEASKCPNITKVLYTDATGDRQRTIATSTARRARRQRDRGHLFGDATLPAIRAAHGRRRRCPRRFADFRSGGRRFRRKCLSRPQRER